MSNGTPKLLSAIFNGKPEDDLIVKNVYQVTDTAVYNNFKDVAKNLSSILNSIPSMNLGDMLGKVNNALQGVKNGINSINSMARNGINGVSSMLGAINNLGNASGLGGARSALGGLIGAIGGIANAAGLQGLTNALQGAYACMGSISQIVNSINGVVDAGRGLQNTIEGAFGGLLGGSGSRYASESGLNRYGSYNSVYGGYNDTSSGYDRAFNSDNYLDISYYPYSNTGTTSANAGSTSAATTSSIKPAASNVSISNVDVTEIARNLSAGNLDLFSNINNLPESVIPMMTSGISNEQITSNVVAQIGNSVSRLAPDIAATTAKPLLDIVNNITDGKYETTITDRGATAALISGVTYVANEVGMTDVFKNIAENVKDTNILVEAAKPIVQKAIDTGDMRLLSSICVPKVASELNKIAPDICGTILANIERPETLAEQEYSRYYQHIRESFDAINSDWIIYKRCSGEEAVNAAQLSGNFFILDLIRAQLTEMMHPGKPYHVGNLQSVYSDSYKFNAGINERIDRIISHPDEDGNVTSLDLGTAVAENYDFTARGNAVDPINNSIIIGLDDTSKEISLENESFLLLSGMYLHDSVDECLARDFPEWYISLTDRPIKPCSYVN